MLSLEKSVVVVVVAVGLFAIGTLGKGLISGDQTVAAAPQAAATAGSAVTPQPRKVAAGTSEAMRLLRLMDTDKNGKVSKAEYMAFMAAEFDHRDINHDGELDLSSGIRTSRS